MSFMTMGLESGFTIILAIVGFVIVLIAQAKINSAYSKYGKVKVKKGVTGVEVARQILDKNGLTEIYIVETKGKLTDHYDPRRKVIRLSTDIFHGDSIASVSVAAHEVGHAIQDKDNYLFMKIRASLVPVVNIVSYLGYFTMLISIFAGITAYLTIGILIILSTLVFQLVTLPVEFDASKRAKEELLTLELIDKAEVKKSDAMLSAAAMTYVASLVSTLLSLLRLVIMARDAD
ncbi:MAG: zinc metallopeptidase [Bacilli bacterium]|nr:zinc metallopeptidase [Bacilli bacterium]MDD4283078.1 zinc metallopeptidase [Bacilli bacterium]MDD4718891.1 zinc metallopeptidase [Bacilli bacterium]